MFYDELFTFAHVRTYMSKNCYAKSPSPLYYFLYSNGLKAAVYSKSWIIFTVILYMLNTSKYEHYIRRFKHVKDKKLVDRVH